MNKLNIIHVSGTKGKVNQSSAVLRSATMTVTDKILFLFYPGSTCVFTESILRTHGFRTGFYRNHKIRFFL